VKQAKKREVLRIFTFIIFFFVAIGISTCDVFAQDPIIIRPLDVQLLAATNSAFMIYNAKDADQFGTAAHVMTDFDAGAAGGTDPIVRYKNFDPPHFFLANMTLKIDVDAINNAAGQWQIEYSEDFSAPTPTWNPVPGGSGGNLPVPPDFDNPLSQALTLAPSALASDLAVRVSTTPVGTNIPVDLADFIANAETFPQVRLWDIRVEAIFDSTTGGEGILEITTDSPLPEGVANELYPPPDGGGLWIEADGGFPASYVWCYSSTGLPAGMDLQSQTSVLIATCDPPATPSADYVVLTEGPPTAGGQYTFTLKVSDGTQSDEKVFVLDISGLGMTPTGTKLPIGKKGSVYPPPPAAPNIDFTPVGGTGPYFWCYEGTIPSGLSLQDPSQIPADVPFCSGSPTWQSTNADGHITLSGTPIKAKMYALTLRLKDSSVPPYEIEKTYSLQVLPAGVTIKPMTFPPLIRGVPYGIYGGEFPLYLEASQVTNSVANPVTWTVPVTGAGYLPLPNGLVGPPTATAVVISDSPTLPQRFSRAEIDGTIPVDSVSAPPTGTPTGDYPFSASVSDLDNPIATTDEMDFTLTVLPRQTKIEKTQSTSSIPCKTGIFVTYGGVTGEADMRVGSMLTNTTQTLGAKVLNFFPATDQLLIEDTDVTRWAAGNSLTGYGSFAATISASRTIPYLPFTVSSIGGAPSLMEQSLLFTYSVSGNPLQPTLEEVLKVGSTLNNLTRTVSSTVKYYSYDHNSPPWGATHIAVADTTALNWQVGDSISSAPFGTVTPQLWGYFNSTITGVVGVQLEDALISPQGKAQYNYAWYTTAVGGSPALDTTWGLVNNAPTVPPYDTEPLQIAIPFESGGSAVSGTYDIQFWAQDTIARLNPPDSLTTPPDPPDHPVNADTNDLFEFTPVTVRVRVNPPSERDDRPIKLRQEQFR